MHQGGVVALDEERLVSVADEQRPQLVCRDARQDGRVGDLVAVEMQDRQHRAVAHRAQELVGVPGGRQRPGLGLAIADDAGHHQVGIVEGRAEGVRQRVAEFAALMDRARHVGRRVARNAARKRELAEQFSHPAFVQRDIGVELAVAAFEPGVGDHRRSAMPRSADIDHVGILRADDAVEMCVDEAQAGRRAPMAEQARLDVLERQAARAAAGCRSGRSARSRDSWRRATRRRSRATRWRTAWRTSREQCLAWLNGLRSRCPGRVARSSSAGDAAGQSPSTALFSRSRTVAGTQDHVGAEVDVQLLLQCRRHIDRGEDTEPLGRQGPQGPETRGASHHSA